MARRTKVRITEIPQRTPDPINARTGVLRTLLEQLRAAGVITEDLAVPDDFSDLELVYRGLCKLPGPGAKRRRIDFLCVPWESRGAALLYYTGDDIVSGFVFDPRHQLTRPS